MGNLPSRKRFFPWRLGQLVPYVIAGVMIAYAVILFALVAADVQKTGLLVDSIVS